MRNKIAFFIRLFFCLVISVVLSVTAYRISFTHYNIALLDFCNSIFKPQCYQVYINDKTGYNIFRIFKLTIYLVTVLWFATIFGTIIKRKSLLPQRFENVSYHIADVIAGNVQLFKDLQQPLKYILAVLMLIQGIIFITLTFVLPYHYDEAYSYLYFSGNGVLTSWCFYPLPNNHVLYNIISSCLLKLQLNLVATTRFASVVASLFTTWYFFKLVSKITNDYVALISTCLLTFSYAFILYGTQARGYAFIILFALLCIYCCVNIMSGDKCAKYMFVYAAASIAGFFTMPSFLYCFAVLDAILLIYFLLKKEKIAIWNFLLVNIVIAAVTLFLYTPIIWCNGWQVLVTNNAIVNRDTAFVSTHISGHLKETWGLLTGYCGIGIYGLVILIGAALCFLKRKEYAATLAIIVIALMLSPLPIIFIHKTIPFPRTWVYLLLPIYIAIAMLLDIVYGVLKNKISQSIWRIRYALCNACMISIIVATTIRFYNIHAAIYDMDYVADKYGKLLGDKKNNVASIAIGKGDAGFYLKDILLFESKRKHKDSRIKTFFLQGGTTTPNADIVILDKQKPISLDFAAYDTVVYSNPYFIVCLRKGL